MQHVTIEWREVNHRVHGPQRLPQSVRIPTLEDALSLIGKYSDADQFRHLAALTREMQPGLLPWLEKRPLKAIALHDRWLQLLRVVNWIRENPRPAIYLRQVDIPGIHSKFIEAHRALLTEWLDLILPTEAIDAEHTGTQRFSARYGFLDRPARIRFRVLDDRIEILPNARMPDLTLDAESFAQLHVPAPRIFITENETNFLAFPCVEKSIAIFGAGYGWDALAKAKWLQQCAIHYWGDIDTHGFAILDQLRRHFSHVRSFLMDCATLLAHEPSWGIESDPVRHELPHLTASEHALYDELRDNRIRPNLRLEQELIGFGWLRQAVSNLLEKP